MGWDLLRDWNNFFVAELGAAAALTGLLFVAVSINLTRIMQFPHLPARAAEALLALISVLVVSTFALVPQQSAVALGLEIAITGVVVWTLETVALIRTRKNVHQAFMVRILLNQLPGVPFVIAGGLLIAHRPAGLNWIVPGVLLSFLAGVFDAWVLLVEILR
jgi:modulator of FtsH protease